MSKVLPKIRAAGKNVGAGGNSPADAAGVAEFINLGANFITVSSQGLLRLAGQDFRKRVGEAL
jgi:2-keto-3-deoxy-L-rhamnonate aldolase RhmA